MSSLDGPIVFKMIVLGQQGDIYVNQELENLQCLSDT